MKQISILIKPTSSLCNMKCAYCFYEDVAKQRNDYSKGMMDEKTSHRLIDEVFSLNVSQINFCFQGGEPTRIDISFYHDFVAYVSKQNKNNTKITYAIQTNGLALNEAWYQLFEDHHFLVGISLDGFRELHDAYRLDLKGKGTFDIVFSHIKEMEKRNITYNILTVLTSKLAKYPKEVFDFYKTNHLNYIQFIPCLPDLNRQNDEYALTPQAYFEFFKVMFDCWEEEYFQGNYLSVSLFDQLIPMYLGIAPSTCGMLGRCSMQVVVEGDGSIYPCDFYVLDKYYCGNIHDLSLKDILQSDQVKAFLTEKQEISPLCLNCAFYKMCYGNCKRMNVCMKDETYCGYQAFLKYSQEHMYQIARQMKKL